MRFASLHGDRRSVFFLSLAFITVVFSFISARAQDSSAETFTPRSDRPELALTVKDSAGAQITSAGTVKLLLNGVLVNESGLSHGRAFFQMNALGDYTLVVDATGYKSVQKDINVSISMRYEVEANLQREGSSSEANAAPARPLLAPKAKEALDKALQALSENKIAEAEKHLAEAAKLAPNNPDVLYVQGVLYLDKKDWTQAQSVLQKSSQMDPSNGRAFAALGMAFADQGKFDAAIPPLEKSLQLDAGTWDTHWALGRAYYHQQQYDQALKTSQLAWTEANGKAPQIELLVAQSLTAVGKYDEAAEALRDFLSHYGSRPEAQTARRWLDGLAKNGKIHPN